MCFVKQRLLCFLLLVLLVTLSACNEVGNRSSYNLSNSIAANTATVSAQSQEDIISKYVYAASGNKIEMFSVESGGGLSSLGAVSSGLSSSAVVSSIAIPTNKQFVYATFKNGINDDKLWILRINHVNGLLTPITNSIISTGKTGSSSIVVAKDGKSAYVTNAKEVCTYPININGTITDTPSCVAAANTPYNQVILSASNKYAYVMGKSSSSNDALLTFKRNATTGTLSTTGAPATISMPSYSLSMAIPESGKFMYVALKGNSSVGQYKIESASGKVLPLSGAPNVGTGSDSEPHAVAITPDGKYAYVTNFHNNNISMFVRNATDGKLQTPALGTIAASAGPDKIAIDADGEFVYASTATGAKSILQYKINPNGTLTALTPSSIPVTESISQIAIILLHNNDDGLQQISSRIIESNITLSVGDNVYPTSIESSDFALCKKSVANNSYGTTSDDCVTDLRLEWVVALSMFNIAWNAKLAPNTKYDLIVKGLKDDNGADINPRVFHEISKSNNEFDLIVPPLPYTNVSPYIKKVTIHFDRQIAPVSVNQFSATKRSNNPDCCPVVTQNGNYAHTEESPDCDECGIEMVLITAAVTVSAPGANTVNNAQITFAAPIGPAQVVEVTMHDIAHLEEGVPPTAGVVTFATANNNQQIPPPEFANPLPADRYYAHVDESGIIVQFFGEIDFDNIGDISTAVSMRGVGSSVWHSESYNVPVTVERCATIGEGYSDCLVIRPNMPIDGTSAAYTLYVNSDLMYTNGQGVDLINGFGNGDSELIVIDDYYFFVNPPSQDLTSPPIITVPAPGDIYNMPLGANLVLLFFQALNEDTLFFIDDDHDTTAQTIRILDMDNNMEVPSHIEAQGGSTETGYSYAVIPDILLIPGHAYMLVMSHSLEYVDGHSVTEIDWRGFKFITQS